MQIENEDSIKNQIAVLEAQLAQVREAAKKTAIVEIKALIEKNGIVASDIFPKRKSQNNNKPTLDTSKKPAIFKSEIGESEEGEIYKANTKGRKPEFVKELLKKGKDSKEMQAAIANAKKYNEIKELKLADHDLWK